MKRVIKFVSIVIASALSIGCSSDNNEPQDYKFDGLIPFNYVDDSNPTGVSREFVYLNTEGKEVLKSSDIEGLDLSLYNFNITPPLFAKNGLAYFPMLKAYINKKGRQVIKLKDYDAIEASSFWEDRALILSLKERAYVAIDSKGRKLFTLPLNGAVPTTLFNNGYIVLFNERGGKTQFIDRNGAVALEVDPKEGGGYRAESELSRDGLILARKKGEKGVKHGAIDIKGEEVIDFVYDNMSVFDNNGYAVVCKENMYGIINSKGEATVPVTCPYPIRLCDDNRYFINVPGEGGNTTRFFDSENKRIDPSTVRQNRLHGGRYITTSLRNGGYVAQINDTEHDTRLEVAMFDSENNIISDSTKRYAITYNKKTGVTQLTAIDWYYIYGRPYTHISDGNNITY